MTDENLTWAVVATVDEPPILVAAFVAWHLSLGAAEVVLFFDRPDDPAADLMAQVPGVQVVRCDMAYWKAQAGRRPDKHQIRQVSNARQAFATCHADWLLHCDADEFIWAEQPVHERLASLQPQTQCGIVPVAERAFLQNPDLGSVFTGVFRRPFNGRPDIGRQLFGRGYAMTDRGLTGHSIGKSFLRKAAALKPSIHRPKPLGGAEVPTERVTGLTMLHFDGLTPLHWIYKILRKADAVANKGGMPASRHRRRQIESVLEDVANAFAVHDRLKRLDTETLENLKAHDLVLVTDFTPEPALAFHFPDADKSLGQNAVDDWLWANKPTILRKFGLAP
ncbi:MAG: glycosyltransferase family 2 protein [Pseudomonadota bacterium]